MKGRKRVQAKALSASEAEIAAANATCWRIITALAIWEVILFIGLMTR